MNKEQPPPYFIEVLPGLQSRQSQIGSLLPPVPPRPMSVYQQNRGYQPPKLGWRQDAQKNWPQSYSLAAAVIIFISGGMSLSWSLGFSPLYSNVDESVGPHEQHMQICWFLAVIIGALLGAVLIDILQKRILNLWASGLVLINGILFVSAPESSVSIIFARYCDGIAVGLTIMAAIVAGSEQAVKRFRGIILTAESGGIMTGIMLKTIFASIWNDEWEVSSNRMHGIIAFLLGVLALVCTSFLTIESPVFFLRQEKEQEAIDSLIRLQKPSEETHETYSLLYENKDLLKEDINRGHLENMHRSYMPMLKLCLYRSFVSMSFSIPLNWSLLMVSRLMVDENCWWSSYIYGIMRMMGVMVSVFTLDTIGRRGLTAIAMLVGSGLVLGIGSVFSNSENFMDDSKMLAVVILLMIYQLLSGVAAPASTVYLGEAFTISLKPVFILMAVIFENVVQIIICCSFGYTDKALSDYCFILGGLQMVFAISFVFIMPETKQTTLRDALKLFKRNINLHYKIKFIRVNKA